MANRFHFSSFIVRLVIALALVFLTFNPSGYSFYHIASQQQFDLPILVLAGIVLLIGWVIFLRATFRSLGFIGIILAGSLFGCLAWVAIYYKVLTIDSPLFTYIMLVIVSAILALGMSWSHIRRRLSGQADMDDVDE